jgi:NTE family protein
MLSFLRKHVGRDTQIEDLPIPFVIATTDVVTREAVHIDSGPLAEALVASATVPGVFPPVPLVGRRLVDGGAADPVPVKALRDRGADIVIAVNIMTMGRGALGAFVQLPSVRLPMPGLLENLFIGLDTIMAQLSAHSCRQADVIVAPTSDGQRWYDVMPRQSWSKAGERAMRAALPEVRRLLSPTAQPR